MLTPECGLCLCSEGVTLWVTQSSAFQLCLGFFFLVLSWNDTKVCLPRFLPFM